jgi:predicted nucleic acid-binding protein
MRGVAVDANVFVSFFIDRNAGQHAAARALVQSAEDGEIIALVPQSVVFEVAYVVQSQYGATGDRLATVVRAVTTFPGVQLVDECPWKRVLDIWPDPVTGLADAVIVAVAIATQCDAVATFDRKLANKLEAFGLAAYF